MWPAFVWTSTKNEWNAQNVIWSRAFRPSTPRNLITRILTICQIKLTQSTVLEQKRLVLRSLSPALPNIFKQMWATVTKLWCGWIYETEYVFPRFLCPDRLHSVDPRNNLTTNTSGQNSISLKGVVPRLRWWMSTITAGRKMRRGMGWMSMICLRSPRPPSLLYLRHCITSFRQASWHRLWG